MIALIAAVSQNNVIGKNGKLPWRCPSDLKFFSKTTKGHTVVMGRKTLESIGNPLPERTNVVISRTFPFSNIKMNGSDLIWLPSPNGYIDDRDKEVFIIGGESIYKQTLGFADRIYITRILADIDGDTFFPQIDPTVWKADDDNPPIVKGDNDDFPMQFLIYRKR
jgi:dihydrofolate reductase